MRKVTLGAGASVLLSIASLAAAAEPAMWSVSEASGDVILVDHGRTLDVAPGATLSGGSAIRTGVNGRVVLARGGERVVISPRSQLKVAGPTESRGGLIQMIAESGTALFRMERRPRRFGVQTPYLTALAHATTFAVTLGADGASVQPMTGAVEVSTIDGGATETIRPGALASVGASDLHAMTIRGDAQKVIRSAQAPAGHGRALPEDATAPGPEEAPLLVMASMDSLLAEESASLPRIAPAASGRSSPADNLLAELGAGLLEPPQAESGSQRRSTNNPDDVGGLGLAFEHRKPATPSLVPTTIPSR